MLSVGLKGLFAGSKTPKTLTGIETKQSSCKNPPTSSKTPKTLTGIETQDVAELTEEGESSKTPKTLTGIETGDRIKNQIQSYVPKPPKPLQGLKPVLPAGHLGSSGFQNPQNPYRD